MKTLVTVIFSLIWFSACRRLLEKGSPEKQNAEAGLPSPVPQTAPTQKPGQDIPPDQFVCNEGSPALIRFNREEARQEYCKNGSWESVPASINRLHSRAEVREESKSLSLSPDQEPKATPSPQVTREQRTPLTDPQAYRCRKSKRFDDSYLCRRSQP